jgi:hypothetical protein
LVFPHRTKRGVEARGQRLLQKYRSSAEFTALQASGGGAGISATTTPLKRGSGNVGNWTGDEVKHEN